MIFQTTFIATTLLTLAAAFPQALTVDTATPTTQPKISPRQSFKDIPACLPPTAGAANIVRSPCPFLNAFSNHGLFPHDGKNISSKDLDFALKKIGFKDFLLNRNFRGNWEKFTSLERPNLDLDWLNKHNLIEHDASLSRSDAYFSNGTQSFDSAVFDKIGAFATDGKMDVRGLARWRNALVASCKSLNPQCTFGFSQNLLATGQAAFLIVFFQDDQGFMDVEEVKEFFRSECLPKTWTPLTAASVVWNVAKLKFNQVF